MMNLLFGIAWTGFPLTFLSESSYDNYNCSIKVGIVKLAVVVTGMAAGWLTMLSLLLARC